jgi:hypothetical protein
MQYRRWDDGVWCHCKQQLQTSGPRRALRTDVRHSPTELAGGTSPQADPVGLLSTRPCSGHQSEPMFIMRGPGFKCRFADRRARLLSPSRIASAPRPEDGHGRIEQSPSRYSARCMTDNEQKSASVNACGCGSAPSTGNKAARGPEETADVSVLCPCRSLASRGSRVSQQVQRCPRHPRQSAPTRTGHSSCRGGHRYELMPLLH